MTYPCGIIRDLLPLYIDDVCNKESRQAVETHLAECKACRESYEAMSMKDEITHRNITDPDDVEMAYSLKQAKKKINKRITSVVACVAAAALTCIGGYHLLFNAAIKDVSLKDVSVFANVYPLEELIEHQPEQEIDPDNVSIFADDHDDSDLVAVRIPEIGNALVSISEDVMDGYQHISIISFQSNFFLRTILKERVGDTIYVTAIKTTILNNDTAEFAKNICTLEFGEINRIAFVEEDGTETVLWSR